MNDSSEIYEHSAGFLGGGGGISCCIANLNGVLDGTNVLSNTPDNVVASSCDNIPQ